MKDKNTIRKYIKNKKKQLTEKEIDSFSNIITDKFLSLEEYIKCNTIFTYINFNQEVKTNLLIESAWKDKKKVAIPKVVTDKIDFYLLENWNRLEQGFYSIMEPISNILVKPNNNSIVILPGLAFDNQKNRIGYGGGYYDKYLSQYPNILKIALCYDFQIIDSIPTNQFDIKADIIITNNRIII